MPMYKIIIVEWIPIQRVVESPQKSSSSSSADQEFITLVRINRPAVRNCVDTATSKELYDAFQTFDEDASSPVAILYGDEKAFCGGYDLSEVGSTAEHQDQDVSSLSARESSSSEKSTTHFQEVLAADKATVPDMAKSRGPMGPSRLLLKKPVIAAVSGFAVAGGLELACWCDLIVAEKSAVFGVFCRRFGVPLIDGGTVRLTNIVGLNRARELVLTGRALGAVEAHQWGLVNYLVEEPNAVLAKAVSVASDIVAAGPAECMRSDRESLMKTALGRMDGYDEDMREELRLGRRTIETGVSAQGGWQFSVGKVGRHGASRSNL